MGGHRRSGRRQPKAACQMEAAAGDAAGAAPLVRAAKGARGLRPSLDVVMRAIDSLYEDQLKPFGRILRKRLAEQASGVGISRLYVPPGQEAVPLPEVDVAFLQAICQASGELYVQPEEGGDWSAVVVGRPVDFVDVYDLEDPYSREFWAKAEAYFASLTGPDDLLPGGRYACAQALAVRGLDFFEGRSLGQICHVVQLAIAQRKVLGYCNGAVVPYSASQSMMKEHCAEQQQPTASSDAAAMPLATWEVARTYLRDILEAAALPDEGPAMVPLSNVKRLFRSRYHTELSETMLGHSRLSDLIQDERFNDLCSLELQKSGYVVVQRQPPVITRISLADSLLPPSADAMISLSERLQLRAAETAGASLGTPRASSAPRPFCVDEPLLFEDFGGQTAEAGDAAYLSMSTPLPSPGVPASTTVKHWLGEPHRLAFLPDESEPLSSDQESADEPRRVAFCPDEPLCLEDAAPGLDVTMPLAPLSVRTPLPSPGVPPSATVRRWTGLSDFFTPGLPAPAESGRPAAATRAEPPTPLSFTTPLPSPGVPLSATARKWSDAPRRVGFCHDEPLGLEEVQPGVFDAPTPLASPGVPGSATVRRWAGEPHRLEFFHELLLPTEDISSEGTTRSPGSGGTPLDEVFSASDASARSGGLPNFASALSALASAGGLVQNTFIHAKPLPPTPLLARRRAHSAPRDSSAATRQSPLAEIAHPAAPSVEAMPSPAQPPSALQSALMGLEPLEEPTTPPNAAAALASAASAPRWLAVSPVDHCVRLTVRNTFLHSAPTPGAAASAARRSQSTPPDVNSARGAAEALGQALRVLPQLLDGIESTCDIALTPGGCKSPDALPAFVPLSPALTASPTDRGFSWLGASGPAVGHQHVVRLADYV